MDHLAIRCFALIEAWTHCGIHGLKTSKYNNTQQATAALCGSRTLLYDCVIAPQMLQPLAAVSNTWQSGSGYAAVLDFDSPTALERCFVLQIRLANQV